ncbi:MAG: hypothetical protein IPO52_03910 [Gemmatimonadetes bacterium]|nr:hypothetical protein [Gemmatimonadota bacterium]MBP6442887.1 hypothetical protein [Gemmatimonadales bacterium]MBK9548265.1 hypothetical protein [Gemmatimonadota bacterium]MBL0178941.1 hypothetical protein [Gemmatimonadota bacterium]MBP6570140.1 hypothetical protein [Gemmatimonadales bacterium]
MIRRRALRFAVAFGLLGAPVLTAQTKTLPDSASLIPAGFGRLNQDVITLRLGTGSLDIRIVPLEEGLLRLLSPDGYRALTNLVAGEQKRLDSLGAARGLRQPGLALVTFFGLAPNTRFDPQLLTVMGRNQLYRPVGVLPLSPGFSNQQLDARGQATAIIVYERPLPVLEPFTVSYLSASSTEWERKLQRLNAERARIVGRAAAAPDTGRRVP